MSAVKEIVSKIHLGILELAVILIMMGIWLVAYSEAYTIYSYRIQIEGVEHTSFLQVGIYPFVGSLLTMLIPVYLMYAKSKFSLKGEEIDGLEILVLMLLFTGALGMMFLTYDALDSALQTLNTMGKLNKDKILANVIYDYRMSNNLNIITANAFLDLLVGAMSIYEINRHKPKAKIIPIKDIKAKSEDDSKVIITPDPRDKPKDNLKDLVDKQKLGKN